MKAGRVIGALLGAALIFFAVGAFLSNEPASKTDQGRIMIIVAFVFGFLMVVSNAAAGSKPTKSVSLPASQPECPTCKKPIQADYQICPYCATSLHRHCPNCHKEIGPDFNLCPYCGTALTQP
jgi:RNA polymerase subunit RPABC4/transcription elongation factor Spt4